MYSCDYGLCVCLHAFLFSCVCISLVKINDSACCVLMWLYINLYVVGCVFECAYVRVQLCRYSCVYVCVYVCISVLANLCICLCVNLFMH